MYSPLLVDAFSAKTTQLKLPNMSLVVQEAEKTTHESLTFESFKWKKWCHSQKSTMTNEKRLKKSKRLPKKSRYVVATRVFLHAISIKIYVCFVLNRVFRQFLHLPLTGIGDSSRVKHEHVNAVAFSKSPHRK